MSGFDFRVVLHKGIDPRSFNPAYIVSVTETEEAFKRVYRPVQFHPYTEEGYVAADAMAQRLVFSLENVRSDLNVDYLRAERTHEEAVE